MEQIGIQEVLATIRSTTDSTAPFILQIVTSTGRSAGRIRTLGACIKGTPSGPEIPKTGPDSTRGKFLHKEHDTIPIIDLEDGHQYKSILISHIIGFNNKKVIH